MFGKTWKTLAYEQINLTYKQIKLFELSEI